MSKFVVVKEAPLKLEKGEVVINPPDFIEEIQLNARRAPRLKQTGVNHLREILNSIAQKYDPEMNTMKFKLVNYEGIAYTDDAELSSIILRILQNERPSVFDSYLDHQIKSRPINTKLVYYLGSFNSTTPFYKNGLDLIEERDIESYITGKPKKVVGKPAITKEEAENN